nr:hypothetical protein [Mesorhizobium kowhaii]
MVRLVVDDDDVLQVKELAASAGERFAFASCFSIGRPVRPASAVRRQG